MDPMDADDAVESNMTTTTCVAAAAAAPRMVVEYEDAFNRDDTAKRKEPYQPPYQFL